MVALGAALGLATLTKASAFVFALPFLVWLAVRMRTRLGQLAAVVVVSGLLLIGANGGQFARNYDLYGSPFGPDGEGDRQEIKYLNGYFSWPELASNVLRNTTLQISTPVSGLNHLMERAVVAVHRGLGIDPSDPQTTYGTTRFSVRQASNGEDTAGNPLHFALLVGVAVVVVASRRYRRSPLLPYLLCLAMGFLLFSLLLRWQPWNSRLMLPLFVLGSAVTGSVLGDIPRRLPMAAFAIGLTLAATPWLVANRSRPLVASAALQTSPSILATSRTDQYFAKRPQLEEPYRSAAALIAARGAQRVGLICHEDAWEYPLWVLLGSGRRPTPIIEHAAVRNVSARLGSPDLDAFDAIVCLDCQPQNRDRLEGQGFQLALDDGPVTVLFAAGGGDDPGS
jgi:4-amino-4-deoxy-L-arabinose transferase-like glycosyltransferase